MELGLRTRLPGGRGSRCYGARRSRNERRVGPRRRSIDRRRLSSEGVLADTRHRRSPIPRRRSRCPRRRSRSRRSIISGPCRRPQSDGDPGVCRLTGVGPSDQLGHRTSRALPLRGSSDPRGSLLESGDPMRYGVRDVRVAQAPSRLERSRTQRTKVSPEPGNLGSGPDRIAAGETRAHR